MLVIHTKDSDLLKLCEKNFWKHQKQQQNRGWQTLDAWMATKLHMASDNNTLWPMTEDNTCHWCLETVDPTF